MDSPGSRAAAAARCIPAQPSRHHAIAVALSDRREAERRAADRAARRRERQERQNRAERVPVRPQLAPGRPFRDWKAAQDAIWDAVVHLAPEESSGEFTRVPPTLWLSIIERHWRQVNRSPLPLNARRYGDPAIAATWDLAASAHVYISYGSAGGREEVINDTNEVIESLIGSDPDEYVRWIEEELVDLRKLVLQFEDHRDSWRELAAKRLSSAPSASRSPIGRSLSARSSATRMRSLRAQMPSSSSTGFGFVAERCSLTAANDTPPSPAGESLTSARSARPVAAIRRSAPISRTCPTACASRARHAGLRYGNRSSRPSS